MAVIRVASYNIRSLRDDAGAVAQVLAGMRLDVALIQEAPRFLGHRRKLQMLAARADLRIVTGGRNAAAMAVLAAPDVTVLDTRDILLPKTPRMHQRGIAMASLEVHGMRLRCAALHLGLSPEERVRNLDAILPELTDDLPLLIGADVNELPGLPQWQRLAAGRLDALVAAAKPLGELTYSALDPIKRIDAIFCSPDFRVISAGVPDGLEELMRRATDHRPVFAELDLS